MTKLRLHSTIGSLRFRPTLHETEIKTDDAEVPVVLLRCELWVGPEKVLIKLK